MLQKLLEPLNFIKIKYIINPIYRIILITSPQKNRFIRTSNKVVDDWIVNPKIPLIRHPRA